MSEPKSLQLYVRSGKVQDSIEQTLKDRADDFTTSLLTVINGNPLLQECDPQEVVRTALKAASMRLPIDPNLGLAYIIPYNNNKQVWEEYQDPKGVTRKRQVWVKRYEPQLQIGWKGFIQLALRTRLYKTINVTDVREGEYKGEDYLTGAIQFDWNQDREARKKLPVTGYVAYFRLHDGFEKILYMTVEELEAHAKQYSKSYAKGNGKWKDDKPNMSKKTVVKLIISKWGPQSTEIQKALRADQAAMADDDTYKYVDNDGDGQGDVHPPETPQEHPDDEAQQHPADDIIEGEVSDASDDKDTAQADAPAATAPEVQTAGASEPAQDAPVAPGPPKSAKETLQEKIAASKARREAAKNEPQQ